MSRDRFTSFGFFFKSSLKTPHKFPDNKPEIRGLRNVANDLYPTGRAFSSNNSTRNKIHEAVDLVFKNFLNEVDNLFNRSYPDNEQFNYEDSFILEQVYGLPTDFSSNLNVRKRNILNKMAFKRYRYRQGLKYIEYILNEFGYEVGIYENKFFDSNGNLYQKLPTEIQQGYIEQALHGGISQHGLGIQHGIGGYDIIANSADDENYFFGGAQNLWASFFIAGKNNIFESANIQGSKKREFKSLVLSLKPSHTFAFTFINYI